MVNFPMSQSNKDGWRVEQLMADGRWRMVSYGDVRVASQYYNRNKGFQKTIRLVRPDGTVSQTNK
jgi:hypothetical protein